MELLEAIKQEEQKLEKELSNLQEQLDGVRAAAKALGGRVSQKATESAATGPKKKGAKRVMSPAWRAKIAKAAKARWAKFHAENGKGKKRAINGSGKKMKVLSGGKPAVAAAILRRALAEKGEWTKNKVVDYMNEKYGVAPDAAKAAIKSELAGGGVTYQAGVLELA